MPHPSGKKTARARPATNTEHLIMRRMGHAIGNFGLIEPNDRILVAVSGGKDSFALLHILDLHRRRSPFDFSLVPVFLDAGWDKHSQAKVAESFSKHGYQIEIVRRDIRSNVIKHLRPNSNPCALCARLRRGVLYNLAPDKGCNKIALGHHLDDFLETLLLNIFFTGQIKSMAVKLRSNDKRNLVIRPLVYVEEKHIQQFILEREFEAVKVDCPYYSDKADPSRVHMRKLIDQVSLKHPRTRRSMLAAMQHIRHTHLLAPLHESEKKKKRV